MQNFDNLTIYIFEQNYAFSTNYSEYLMTNLRSIEESEHRPTQTKRRLRKVERSR